MVIEKKNSVEWQKEQTEEMNQKPKQKENVVENRRDKQRAYTQQNRRISGKEIKKLPKIKGHKFAH